MYEPLLRSTRALEGLFHRAVVVGEADADRAFYDEINRRLVEVGRGIPDSLFLNAQNWSTEARVIAPLRKLGVPAAGVLDLDTLWNRRGEWKKLYDAVGISEGSSIFSQLEADRSSCASDRRERQRCKENGLAALPKSKRDAARRFIASLASYGIFVVPVGELENWLSSLTIPTLAKHEWIVKMLAGLGSNPASKTYVRPGRGDVWAFLDRIDQWVRDPARRGMPNG
jgi:hypothetical protein